MRILVWEGKHSTDYFDASTPEALAKSALYLMHLFNDSYQYYWEPEDPRLSKYATFSDEDDLTDEQIAALPTEILRETAVKKRTIYRGQMTAWKRDHESWEEGQRILRDEDDSVKQVPWTTSKGVKKVRTVIPAWDYISMRSDYEYERVTLEDVHDPFKDED